MDYVIQTRIGVTLALLLACSSTVTAAGDMSEQQGQEVFETIAGIGCKTCHGDFAEGDLGVGPFIRGATEGAIRAAIDATGEMNVIKSTITDEQIEAVAAYVSYLGSMQVARTLSKRGRFLPDAFATRPGTPIQLIVKNSGIQPATFQSDNMGIEPFSIAGRSTDSIKWNAPESEGEYSLYCTDCKLSDQFFVISVDANAPPYPGTVAATSTEPADDGM